MSVIFKNGGRVAANATIPYVGARVTISAYVRVDSPPSTLGQVLIQRSNTLVTAIGSAGSSAIAFGVRAFRASDGGGRTISTPAGAAVGAVYHVIFVYDKDDPSRQFVAVNGSKTPWEAGWTSALGQMGNIQYGSTSGNNDYAMEHVVHLDGYAATDADVAGLADSTSYVPTLIAAASTAPGVRVIYHSMQGTVGADVHAGDPGVTYIDDPLAAIKEPTRPTPSDVVRYAPPLVAKSTIDVELAYIASSGKTLTVAMNAGPGTGRIAPRAGGLAGYPSVRINGGAPIQVRSPAGGAYVEPSAEGMFFPLPAGVVVAPDDVVTLDAPLNWFTPTIGYAPALSGHPVANYSGRPVSEGLWPDAKPTRVGTNHALDSPDRIALISINKNRAQNCPNNNPEAWPDGTIKRPFSNRIMAQSGAPNGMDRAGIKGHEGLWVIRWDDVDPASPVTFSMGGSGATWATERTDLRNYGDAQGRGKARVYDLSWAPSSFYTLRAAVDATATSIPYVENAGSFGGGYLTIDSEQILIGVRNSTLKQYEGCVRGWNNTTAAPHSAGAVLKATLPARHGQIFWSASSTGADASTIRYRNLAIYEPDQWDGPAGPGPVSVPAPSDPYALDSRFEGYIAPGCGGQRYMTTTPGQGADVCEPEQLTRPELPHFANSRYIEQYFFKRFRKYDPVASPYFYANHPAPNSEMYEATLGEAITSTPAPGAVETIVIANGRSTPVLYGQELHRAGEVMRVVAVPLSGDLYQVERGALNTPTTTHPAGPIQVGWRIPVTQADQYVGGYGNRTHAYEAVLDESRSSPPLYGRNMLDITWGGADDSNLSARLTLTLTAPVDAASLDLYVAPQDPADWPAVARNLVLTLGSEVMVVAAVDPASGRVTVKARGAGAASHPAGATIATKTYRVRIRTPDGRVGYNLPFNTNSIMLPTGVDTCVITTSDETGYGQAGECDGDQVLDPATAASKQVIHPTSYFSYEFTARTTAKSPGAYHWLNVPFRASNGCVYEIAKAIRDNFPPGRKVIFELSNECWNYSINFYQTITGQQLSAATRCASSKDYYILRSQSAFEVAKACFEEVGRGSDILLAICWQTQTEILADCRRLGVEPDVVACAPYLYCRPSQASGDAFTRIDDDQACDLFTFQTLYELTSWQYRSVAAHLIRSADAHQRATGKRPLLMYYEGGLELVVGHGTPGFVDPDRKRQRDIISNPNFYFCERDAYAAFGVIGQVDAFMQFSIAYSAVSSTGNAKFWGMLRGPVQKPGRGDY